MSRQNTLVTIVSEPDFARPLALKLVTGATKIIAGSAMTALLVASGGAGAYAYSLKSGPGWMSVNATTGAVTGTPTAPGRAFFVAKVEDAASVIAEHSFSINVESRLWPGFDDVFPAEVGIYYEYMVSVNDALGAVTWAVQSGSLPSGLTLDSGGLISGTPDNGSDGIYYLVLRATDAYDGSTLDVSVAFDVVPAMYLVKSLGRVVVNGVLPVGVTVDVPLVLPPNIAGGGVPWRDGIGPYNVVVDDTSASPWTVRAWFNSSDGTWYLRCNASTSGRNFGATVTVTDALGATDGGFLALEARVQNRLLASKNGGTPVDAPVAINFTGSAVTSVSATSNEIEVQIDAGGGGSSPLTTKGDLYTHDGSADARLPVGSDGQVLVADSGEAAGQRWADQNAAIVIQIGPDPGIVATPPVLAVQTRFFQVPANYEITGWQIAADTPATLSVDVRASAWPTRPVAGDSITNSNPLTLTAATSNTGTTSGWTTTTLASGSWLAVALTANNSATWLSVQLKGRRI